MSRYWLLHLLVCVNADCLNCEVEDASLVQHAKQDRLVRGQEIVVKGPSASGGTPAEELAPTCASGFNAAYAKCLGGTNSYLMIMVTDATKAYCAYTGGWAKTTDNYPDHTACFASPGQSQPLFYDSGAKTLSDWDGKTVVTGAEQDYTSLSCSGTGNDPCKATVQPKNSRELTKATWMKTLTGFKTHHVGVSKGVNLGWQAMARCPSWWRI